MYVLIETDYLCRIIMYFIRILRNLFRDTITSEVCILFDEVNESGFRQILI